MKWFWRFLLWLSGWKIVGNWPYATKKFIVTVAPHTSNWDFLIGVMARGAIGFRAKYLGKSALFRKPFGWFFKMLGGIPVDRSQKNNLVEYLTEIIEKSDHFILAVAPEGTRGQVTKWKTGFYYIAQNAQIPVLMAGFDYPSKAIMLSELYYPSDDAEKDIHNIKQFHLQIRGKYK